MTDRCKEKTIPEQGHRSQVHPDDARTTARPVGSAPRPQPSVETEPRRRAPRLPRYVMHG